MNPPNYCHVDVDQECNRHYLLMLLARRNPMIC